MKTCRWSCGATALAVAAAVPPASAQAPPVFRAAVEAVIGESRWFGPAERPLHGYLHVPAEPRAGVILCAPIGYEAWCAYATYRMYAEREKWAAQFDYARAKTAMAKTTYDRYVAPLLQRPAQPAGKLTHAHPEDLGDTRGGKIPVGLPQVCCRGHGRLHLVQRTRPGRLPRRRRCRIPCAVGDLGEYRLHLGQKAVEPFPLLHKFISQRGDLFHPSAVLQCFCQRCHTD